MLPLKTRDCARGGFRAHWPAPHSNMTSTHANSIALLIDADNAPAGKIDFILSELASHGVVNIRRAYGNWTKTDLAGWIRVLHENSIQPMQSFDLIKGKNATDMALVIDAMDLLYTKKLNTFCLVSTASTTRAPSTTAPMASRNSSICSRPSTCSR